MDIIQTIGFYTFVSMTLNAFNIPTGPGEPTPVSARRIIAMAPLAHQMSPLAHHFYTMACNNAWANQRLLTACDKLSQADFVAHRTSFFPSIKATLNHILTVDWFYVDALERGLRGEPVNRDVERFLRSGSSRSVRVPRSRRSSARWIGA